MKIRFVTALMAWCVGACLGDGYFTEVPWSAEYIFEAATGTELGGGGPSNICGAASGFVGRSTNTYVSYPGLAGRRIETTNGTCSMCVNWQCLVGDLVTNGWAPFSMSPTNYAPLQDCFAAYEYSWPSSSGLLYHVGWDYIVTPSVFSNVTVLATGQISRVYAPKSVATHSTFRLWPTNAAAGSGAWAYRFGSTDVDSAYAIGIDTSNNVIIAGNFYGTIDFDPAHGGPSSILTHSGGDYCGFLCKYTADGAFVWAKKFNLTSKPNPKAVSTDASGNVFIGGAFGNCSLMKFDSSGTLVWTNCPPGASVTSIAVDSQGDVATTGSFNANYLTPLDMGNGHTIYSILGSIDAFLAKYNSAGSNVFAKTFGNTGDKEYGLGVSIGLSDAIIFAGWSFWDINFSGTNYQNASWGAFGFLSKFASDGTYQWSRAIGLKTPADPTTAWTRIEKVACDQDGNIGVTGTWNYTTDLGSGVNFVNTAVDRNAFVAKYAGTNGAYLWAQPITGDRAMFPWAIAVDSQTNFVTAGYFYGTYYFNTNNAGTNSLATSTPNSPNDIWVAKYAQNSTNLWAKRYGSDMNDGAFGVVCDQSNHPIITGYFQNVMNVDGTSLICAGQFDAFLIRMAP